MARYVMTPARRAALKKAQAASARKRRKGIRRRTIAKKQQRIKNTKKYNRPGAAYRVHQDRKHSRGVYSTNWKGKKLGKGARRANRVASAYNMAQPGYAAVVGASYLHGRRKGTIKKKSRKRRK